MELLIGVYGLFYHDLYCQATGHFFTFVHHSSLNTLMCQALKIAIALDITGPVAILLGMTFPTLAVGLMRYTRDGGRFVC